MTPTLLIRFTLEGGYYHPDAISVELEWKHPNGNWSSASPRWFRPSQRAEYGRLTIQQLLEWVGGYAPRDLEHAVSYALVECVEALHEAAAQGVLRHYDLALFQRADSEAVERAVYDRVALLDRMLRIARSYAINGTAETFTLLEFTGLLRFVFDATVPASGHTPRVAVSMVIDEGLLNRIREWWEARNSGVLRIDGDS